MPSGRRAYKKSSIIRIGELFVFKNKFDKCISLTLIYNHDNGWYKEIEKQVLGQWRQIMYGMKEIIQEAASLPVEERAIVVDSLLKTLNPPDAEIDAEWMKVAKRRLAELKSGKVIPVSGDQVFAKIRERFGE